MKISTSFFFFTIIFLLSSCQQPSPEQTGSSEAGIKVTIMYPGGDGKTFDMDYYTNKHMPMVAELLGESMNGFSIDKGVSGRTPDESIPYVAIGYLYFDEISDYQESFGPNAEKILADIPNYTNIQPVVQISENVK